MKNNKQKSDKQLVCKICNRNWICYKCCQKYTINLLEHIKTNCVEVTK